MYSLLMGVHNNYYSVSHFLEGLYREGLILIGVFGFESPEYSCILSYSTTGCSFGILVSFSITVC